MQRRRRGLPCIFDVKARSLYYHFLVLQYRLRTNAIFPNPFAFLLCRSASPTEGAPAPFSVKTLRTAKIECTSRAFLSNGARITSCPQQYAWPVRLPKRLITAVRGLWWSSLSPSPRPQTSFLFLIAVDIFETRLKKIASPERTQLCLDTY